MLWPVLAAAGRGLRRVRPRQSRAAAASGRAPSMGRLSSTLFPSSSRWRRCCLAAPSRRSSPRGRSAKVSWPRSSSPGGRSTDARHSGSTFFAVEPSQRSGTLRSRRKPWTIIERIPCEIRARTVAGRCRCDRWSSSCSPFVSGSPARPSIHRISTRNRRPRATFARTAAAAIAHGKRAEAEQLATSRGAGGSRAGRRARATPASSAASTGKRRRCCSRAVARDHDWRRSARARAALSG